MTASILLVEDNGDNRALMQYLLQARGYDPLLGRSGAEGIELAVEHRPELILMDIQMPEMDGFEAAAEIRKRDGLSTTTMVAVTALAMVGDQERVLTGGFNGYIEKPLSPETFVDQVEAFLPSELRRDP
jgi:CheY-like chemotaxis protein